MKVAYSLHLHHPEIMFLKSREPELIEEMDREDCDITMLHNTYRQFRYINSLLSKWRHIYSHEIKPVLMSQNSTSLLDIGFGGGDITRSIEKWASLDGFDINITAIDPDKRAYKYCHETYTDSSIEWKKCRSTDLVADGKKYDIVISNHVLHHLKDDEVLKLLEESEQLSTQKVLFNDIERSAIGYFLFSSLSRIFFHNSFITKDGLTSIRRSFKGSELKKLIPKNWRVKRSFPFRIFLVHER